MRAVGERVSNDSMKIPTNHRQAERRLIEMVRSGAWEIDDQGRIWQLKRRGGRGRGGGARIIDIARIRAEKRMPRGYLMVRAMFDGRRVCGLAHRLVWQHLRGDIPDGLVINHKNGRKDDNRVANLEVATYSANSRHCQDNLNPPVLRGSRNGASKLTESDIIDMRTARAAGASLLSLAERFGISYQQVSTITRGHRWKHVRDAPLQVADGRSTRWQRSAGRP